MFVVVVYLVVVVGVGGGGGSFCLVSNGVGMVGEGGRWGGVKTRNSVQSSFS